jgi:hypothetical protein
LKKVALILCLLSIGVVAKAQYNYAEWGFGGGASIIRPYSDLKQNNYGKSFNADLYYNYSPYLPFAFEVQAGKLSGGNDVTDPSHRYFSTNFISFSVHGDLQLGEIMDFDGSFFLQRLKGVLPGYGLWTYR